MKDRCFLLIDFSGLYEKLSRYDLFGFLRDANISAVLGGSGRWCDDTQSESKAKKYVRRWKRARDTYTASALVRQRC